MKLVFLAGAFLVALVAAQQASGPQQKVGSPGSTPKKSTSSLATFRPSPVIGNDIVRVIDSLVAAGAAKGKGEYETKAEYQSRSRDLCARYERLACLLPASASEFTYDADNGEMKLKLQSTSEYLGDDEDRDSVETFSLRSLLVRTGS